MIFFNSSNYPWIHFCAFSILASSKILRQILKSIIKRNKNNILFKKMVYQGVPVGEMNLTSVCEDKSSIPGLAQWVQGSSVAMNCGVGHRCGLDPVLLWLWWRLGAAAPVWPLAWVLPYATSVALKRKKKKDAISHSLYNSSFRIEIHNYVYCLSCKSE